ncbi:MAG: cytochrome bd-I oxidase subunit CydX [Janthinobacterium lividum]|jgi:cyd operon protein YbgT
MWYFAWILGVLLACSFGIINALWLESSDAAALESVSDR